MSHVVQSEKHSKGVGSPKCTRSKNIQREKVGHIYIYIAYDK